MCDLDMLDENERGDVLSEFGGASNFVAGSSNDVNQVNIINTDEDILVQNIRNYEMIDETDPQISHQRKLPNPFEKVFNPIEELLERPANDKQNNYSKGEKKNQQSNGFPIRQQPLSLNINSQQRLSNIGSHSLTQLPPNLGLHESTTNVGGDKAVQYNGRVRQGPSVDRDNNYQHQLSSIDNSYIHRDKNIPNQHLHFGQNDFQHQYLPKPNKNLQMPRLIQNQILPSINSIRSINKQSIHQSDVQVDQNINNRRLVNLNHDSNIYNRPSVHADYSTNVRSQPLSNSYDSHIGNPQISSNCNSTQNYLSNNDNNHKPSSYVNYYQDHNNVNYSQNSTQPFQQINQPLILRRPRFRTAPGMNHSYVHQEEPQYLSQNRPFTTSQQQTNKRGVPVNQWRIYFNGDGRGMHLYDFLSQVNALRKSERIPDDEIMYSIIHLLSGRAKLWYQFIIDQINTWDELVEAFKTEFLPPHLIIICLVRLIIVYKKNGESFAEYVTHMCALFKCLSIEISECCI